MTDLVKALKTLSDETRMNLIKLLLTNDLCVGALANRLAVSEAAVSQHLSKLRKVGLVKGEKRGYWTHYSIDKGKLIELAGLLRDLTALPVSSAGVCIKKQHNKIDCHKEEMKMCDDKCQHPEKLKEKPGKCSLEQIKECHGTQKKHICHGDKQKKK